MSKLTTKLSAIAVATMLFSSCSEDSSLVKNKYEDSKTTGTVSVKVLGSDGAPVDSAMVHNVSTNLYQYTDTLGTVVFSGLEIGQHTFMVEKEDYVPAVISKTISVENATGEQDYLVVGSAAEIIEMKADTLSVSGKVFLQGDQYGSDAKAPAGGITIKAVITNDNDEGIDHKTTVLTTTTGDDGSWTLTNVPENCDISISTLPFTNNDVEYAGISNFWAGNSDNFGDAEGDDDVQYMGKESAVSDEIYEVSNDYYAFDQNNPLEIVFSKSIDTDMIHQETAQYEGVDSDASQYGVQVTDDEGNVIAVNLEWSDDNKTLNIKSATGKWEYGKEHSFTYSFLTTDGQIIETDLLDGYSQAPLVKGDLSSINNFNFSSTIDGDDKSGKANSNTTTVTLDWDGDSDAIGYHIYQKESSDDTYTKVASTSKYSGDTEITIPNLDLADKASCKFKVVAFNDENFQKVSDAPSVEVKDNVGANIAGKVLDEDDYTASLEGTSSATISFNEDMDASKCDLSALSSKSNSDITFDYEWTSERVLKITVEYENGYDSGNSKEFTIDGSKFYDIAGNTSKDDVKVVYYDNM